MSWFLLLKSSTCGQLLSKVQISSQEWHNFLWSCSCTFWFLREGQWLLDSPDTFLLKWWHRGATFFSPTNISVPTGEGLSVWRETPKLVHQQSPAACARWDIVCLSSKAAKRLKRFKLYITHDLFIFSSSIFSWLEKIWTWHSYEISTTPNQTTRLPDGWRVTHTQSSSVVRSVASATNRKLK